MLDVTVDVPPTDSPKDTSRAPRRRRAVSRPAGPPAAAAAPAASTPAVSVPAPSAPAEIPVVTPPQETGDVPGLTTTSDAAAVESRPRRSRAKATRAPVVESKPTEPVEPQPEPVAPSQPEPVAPPEPDDPVVKALVALEGTRAPRRRRAASRPAGAPAPIDLDAITAALANPGTDAVVDPDDVVAEDDDEDEALALGDAEAQDDAELVDDEAADDVDSEDAPRRRRRRRGGRRRRRGPDDVEADEPSDSEPSDGETEPEADAEAEESEAVEGDEPVSASSRRRRRRRRRGEDATAADDDPTEVVVRVREPRGRRRPASPVDEVTGIEGSTRMEAKRQRRREGRAAGRRRAPILSEAEFLARRESVERVMLVRQADDLSQIAVLEDGVLVEHYVDRASAASLIGNVYVGKVQNVLPSMEAAFIDIGRGRNAVLYAGEVDWDAFGADGQSRQVEKVFSSGQSILVQVTKDPVGAKGARLTAHISLPGRYLVYAPGGHLSGISRKLPEQERNRLKDILGDLVAEDASVIIRTAAEGVSEEELVRDITRLKAQWESIEKKVKQGSAPQMLYGEPDLTVRIVRDLFTEDFTKLVVDSNGKGDDAFDTVSAYVNHVAPHLADRVKQWDHEADGDLFTKHRLDEQIAKALERKVFLPSGGSLIIDRTEAMTVIDVNTGKFTGSGGNLEATVTANNLEAAEEIVRQLRL
ncbi:MAG TPA: Rne/Rng family ribonuclease, partial [Coriobacteriia bacterium]